MQKGDLVFVRGSTTSILGVGMVTSDYRHISDEKKRNRNQREVRWVRTGKWETLPRTFPRDEWDRQKKESSEWRSEPRVLPRKTLTEIGKYPRMTAELEILLGVDGEVEAGLREPLPIDEETLEAAVEQVIRPHVEERTFREGGESYLHDDRLPTAQRHLLPEALKEDPNMHAQEALPGDYNPLGWRELDSAKNAFEQADAEDLRRELEELLRGDSPLEERLEAFLDWGQFKDAGERVEINGTVASYLLVMECPALYAFCKPTVYRDAAEALLGPDSPVVAKEEGRRVAHASRLYGEVLRRLRREYELPLRHLLDVHAAFYILSSLSGPYDGSWEDLSKRAAEATPPSVYKIAPGKGAKYWPDCEAGGYICVGWDEVGDLRDYESEGAFREAFYDHYWPDLYDRKQKASEKAGELWSLTQMKPGDRVVANQGTSKVLAVGRVTGEYRWEPGREEFRHVVPVDWDTSFAQPIQDRPHWGVKTVKELPEGFIEEVLSRGEPASYSVEKATQDLFHEREEFEEWLDRLRKKKNIILQGPPGVGKTYVSKKLAYALLGEKAESRVKMVQLHQSYTYEDFIRGYRPEPDGGFRLRDGAFFKSCRAAKNDPENDYVFIIDEINRGNLSKIFGELMMLTVWHKRGPEVAVSLFYQR
jgi:hypothetical protein